ncbi:hypothetical protein [Streptomyces sp. NPDC007883]|uniref:hypothetical protein n=1 Tax=Streptomyces sp. NPDC007883 TaxID=3155116 RepID=UPI0033D5E31A
MAKGFRDEFGEHPREQRPVRQPLRKPDAEAPYARADVVESRRKDFVDPDRAQVAVEAAAVQPAQVVEVVHEGGRPVDGLDGLSQVGLGPGQRLPGGAQSLPQVLPGDADQCRPGTFGIGRLVALGDTCRKARVPVRDGQLGGAGGQDLLVGGAEGAAGGQDEVA